MIINNIEFNESILSQLAKKYNLKEIYLFGSILTDDFNNNSDIDIMITYKDNCPIGYFELFYLKEEIKNIYNREIDIVEKEGLRNPYRRKHILENARLIYAA